MSKLRQINDKVAHLKADSTTQEHEIIQLSASDQQLFAQAILNPTEPNTTLLNAAKRHN